jgi:hypothetical protein
VTSVLADTIPGIRVVKAFAQEQRETERFRDANRHNLAVNDRVNRVWSLFTPSVTLLTEVGLLVVWGFGIWQISRNQITVGVLTAFLAYISRFYLRLDSMSRIVSVTQKAAAGAKRIFDILDHVSSVPEPAQPVNLERVEGRIDIVGAAFRYGNRAVIRGIDLSIKPGEMIGLVGHSGSGKSTLVQLLYFDQAPTVGSAFFTALDKGTTDLFTLSNQRRRHVRNHLLGMVYQNPRDGLNFSFTAGGNIAKTYAIETSHRLRPQILWCQGLKPGARKICPSNRTMEHIAQGRKATDKVMLLENETDVGTQAAERGTIHAAHFTPQELDVAGIGFDQPKAAS